ncbi:5-formyltetrahydrofolate cyclo-ligase [uncultured Roseibium sp.]|uniref:5-formyltetrahydrofolate cyclo-ligase n=1 Tax=uncultured Roseibium sp. TaxID=1936171 RepID=UPI0032178C31
MTQTENSLAAAKDVLRKQALARRAAMDPTQRIEASLALVDAVDSLPVPEGAVVSGFWPIRDEIDPRPLLDRLRASGHRLCLPVVSEPHLIFRELTRETVLVPAGFGTTVPDAASPELRPDVLLMPLAAFDRAGNRIGYGKGHYDTAIAALEKNGPVICIGLAFQTQEVDHVPAEPHDKPLDGILTENGYRSFSGPRS